jgi:hypothetical protein
VLSQLTNESELEGQDGRGKVGQIGARFGSIGWLRALRAWTYFKVLQKRRDEQPENRVGWRFERRQALVDVR